MNNIPAPQTFNQYIEKLYHKGGLDLISRELRNNIQTNSIIKEEVFKRYIHKIMNEFSSAKQNKLPKKSLYYDGNKSSIMNENFSYLDRAIIMTYLKYQKLNAQDPTKYPNGLKVTFDNINYLFDTGVSRFTRDTDSQGISARQYATSHVASIARNSSDWRTTILNQMCNDVSLDLVSELTKSNNIDVEPTPTETSDKKEGALSLLKKVIVKKFYPDNVEKAQEALQSGIVSKAKHVSGEIEGMYYAQDFGTKRKNQEDALLVMHHPSLKDLKIAIVCDGMGGKQNGEFASHIAVQEMKTWFENLQINPNRVDTDVFRENISDRLSEISQKINQSYPGSGTTITGAIIGKNDALVLNVGDSRTYKVKDGKLEQVTTDHSFSHINYELFLKREYPDLKEEDMRFFKKNNVITRYLGSDDPNYCIPSFYHLSSKDYDQLILTSDGISDCIGNEEIVSTLKRNRVQDFASMLVNQAITDLSYNPREVSNNELDDKTSFKKFLQKHPELKDSFVEKVPKGKDNATAIVVDNER